MSPDLDLQRRILGLLADGRSRTDLEIWREIFPRERRNDELTDCTIARVDLCAAGDVLFQGYRGVERLWGLTPSGRLLAGAPETEGRNVG